MTSQEHTRVVQLLIERVDYNGATGSVSVPFHPTGIKTLAVEAVSRSHPRGIK
jgi:site-specific DNA recombinase